ncbi:MAG: NB-ARC domain-containing protein [Sciscionella sp.]
MDATTREECEPKPGEPNPIFSNADLARELRRLLRDTERRWGRGIARAGLAKRIGVSASSLYAYLNGTTLIPADALFHLLRELGVDEQHAHRVRRARDDLTDPDERMQRYQGLLNGKRMLILLDNAFSAEQVRPVLPPGTSCCFVLITSRDRLTGLVIAQGASPLIVDALPEPEARALLAARLGGQRLETEPDVVAEVLTYCAGLLLALSVVSGRAQVNPELSLATLATELRDEATRLGVLDNADPAASLPAVLSWSYNALSTEQARVFALLGIATGPDISLAAAANLTDLPTNEANVILQALERASLIQQHKPGRYRMHDLIRLYAAQTSRSLPADTQTAALRRLVDFFLHTAHTGDRLLSPRRVPAKIGPPVTGCFPQPLADAATALQWFDAEHRCLLAAHQVAIAHGWHTAVWQLAWALNTFHWRRGHLHDHVASWRAGLTAAERLGESTTCAQAHRRLGRAYARVRQTC